VTEWHYIGLIVAGVLYIGWLSEQNRIRREHIKRRAKRRKY